NLAEKWSDVPFLPIQFFKNRKVLTGNNPVQKVFESSGTDNTQTSKHYVTNLQLYKDLLANGFEAAYGQPNQYCLLALLPSYLERKDSSLVEMVKHLMQISAHSRNGFFLNEFGLLKNTLKELEKQAQPTILIGVTFALLDFVEQFQLKVPNIIVMETGGMKGRRNELTRTELHSILKKGFGSREIHSEYGMTELLSQAYSKGKGVYHPPNWMKVVARDVEDPLILLPPGTRGAINIIDLANVHSCSFIATDDIGLVNEDGTFEILGRLDGSEMRGCSLLAV
ncbi:MAG TPA: acyl transferase, partial [Flavobacteriales bacterium]|nr:acyl transferase [Flavobacteriales bacterium]